MFKLNQKVTRLPAPSSAGNTFVHSVLHCFSVLITFVTFWDYWFQAALINAVFNLNQLCLQNITFEVFFETLYSLMYPYLPNLLLECDSLLRQVLEFFLDRGSLLPRNIRLLARLEQNNSTVLHVNVFGLCLLIVGVSVNQDPWGNYTEGIN